MKQYTFTPITEQDAKRVFNWDTERIRQEYKGQQLFTVHVGQFTDLLYQKGNVLGYLTSIITP